MPEPDQNFIPQLDPELLCDFCQARIYWHPVSRLWGCSNPFCACVQAAVVA